MKKFFVRTLAVLSLFALPMAGCDLLGGNDTGTVRVLLTDAPFPFEIVDSANVTIQRVELVGEAGVVVISEEEQPFNLLDLRDGKTAELGEVEVPEGKYEQIRLIVAEEASVVMKDETVYDLKVPSGTETGLKINLPEDFTVDHENPVSLTLDFLVDDSFVTLGEVDSPSGIQGFIFTPVVKLLEINAEPVVPAETEETTDDTTGSTE